MDKTFHGAWPALITPATQDGDLNLAALHDLVAWLLNKKIDGLYLCGSTGEGLLLPPAERRSLVETVMQQVGDRIPIIVHVGSVSTRDAMALAAHRPANGHGRREFRAAHLLRWYRGDLSPLRRDRRRRARPALLPLSVRRPDRRRVADARTPLPHPQRARRQVHRPQYV